jgi:hypothetical protein
MGKLRQGRIGGLKIEQSQLGGVVGIHVLIGLTSGWDGTCTVQGSVT